MPLLSSWERKQAEPLNPNLLFAGQYVDDESGLAYNRFRYYDPQSGNYLASDPIGLNGGETPYAYVHNPMGWVDPFGLAKCASVENGILKIKNKFSPNSPEAKELAEFVKKWNEQIVASGGTMTRQAVDKATRRAANKAAKLEKLNNPQLYANGKVAGHISDVGWGGKTTGPFMPLSTAVNSYIGGATQAVDVGTIYKLVQLV